MKKRQERRGGQSRHPCLVLCKMHARPEELNRSRAGANPTSRHVYRLRTLAADSSTSPAKSLRGCLWPARNTDVSEQQSAPSKIHTCRSRDFFLFHKTFFWRVSVGIAFFCRVSVGIVGSGSAGSGRHQLNSSGRIELHIHKQRIWTATNTGHNNRPARTRRAYSGHADCR